jgi:hypothetical protein
MLNERLKSRLTKERAMTSITLRIPVDVVDSLKALAPLRGFGGYQTLLKAYLSEALRRDEALLAEANQSRLIDALQRQGVSAKTIAAAQREMERA